MKYDLAVVIGRFQPFHNGHKALIEQAFEQAHNVLVVIGSSNQPRTPKNPLTYQERVMLISASLHGKLGNTHLRRLNFAAVEDYLYEDNKWIRKVQQAVAQNTTETSTVCVVGHDKDDSTFYLKYFPSYAFVDSGEYIEVGESPINATKIRELMFNGNYTFMKGALPESSYDYLTGTFLKSSDFAILQNEYDFIQSYREQWQVAPYPVTFNTVDSVVLQGGHILLIKRKAAPGAGLWALPGGFINQNETCRKAMLRELREETRLKIPLPILDANITHQQRFDHPGRSLRGRTITEAFLIELPGPEDGKLPKVKGADDAKEARWFPISEALKMGECLFEDHLSIISMLTARAK